MAYCFQSYGYNIRTYVYILGTHIYDICAQRTIFHVVYSSNMSGLFLVPHFSISARATPMEAPSHPSWPAGHSLQWQD